MHVRKRKILFLQMEILILKTVPIKTIFKNIYEKKENQKGDERGEKERAKKAL